MPINLSDPRCQAEITPDTIMEIGRQLCRAYGVEMADAFGAKGNEYHDYGFHRSENWIYLSPDSRYGTGDYSVQGSVNHAPNKDWVCGFDFTPWVWGTAENTRRMIEITTRVYNRAKMRDPRLADLYEFAGTLDGEHVVTFDETGRLKTPFDSSHLHHGHGSIKRSRAGNNHQGIIDVMLGIGEEEDEMQGIAGIVVPPRGEVLSYAIDAGGANAAAQVWVTATNDTGDSAGVAHNYGLRVWVSNGSTWRPINTMGLLKGSNGVTLSAACPARTVVGWESGVRGLTVMRAPIDPAGNVLDPKALGSIDPATLTWYDGPLTIAIERSRT